MLVSKSMHKVLKCGHQTLSKNWVKICKTNIETNLVVRNTQHKKMHEKYALCDVYQLDLAVKILVLGHC